VARRFACAFIFINGNGWILMSQRVLVAGSLALAALAPSAVFSQGGANRPDSAWSGAAAAARAHRTADSLRTRILGLANFAGFISPECSNGELRVFERDTKNESGAMLASLEKLVMSYGAGESLNTEPGKALLRAVTRLELGGPGPRWDTMSGTGPRSFNPNLPVAKATNDCLLTAGTAPDGLVLPPVTNFVPPRDSGTLSAPIEYGPGGLALIRSAYFKAHARDAKAIMHHSRVNAYALWDDYAIVSVAREAEVKGVVALAKETNGVVYAFHRVGAEWRLLALVRTW
jgi:hypothetical protein